MKFVQVVGHEMLGSVNTDLIESTKVRAGSRSVPFQPEYWLTLTSVSGSKYDFLYFSHDLAQRAEAKFIQDANA